MTWVAEQRYSAAEDGLRWYVVDDETGETTGGDWSYQASAEGEAERLNELGGLNDAA